MWAKLGEDLLAKFGVDGWVGGEFSEEEGEGPGGGVAAGEDNVDELVADY